MTVSTSYTLDGPLVVPLGGQAGSLSVANKSGTVPVQVITVELQNASGAEQVVLASLGDSLALDLTGYSLYKISADSYPATILYAFTPGQSLQVASFSAAISGGTTGSAMTVLQESQVTVGNISAVAIVPIASQQAILLMADRSNAGTIYVGASSGVGSSGWPMLGGDVLRLPANAPVYAIASQAGQLLDVWQGA